MNPHLNKVIVSGMLFLGMLVIMTADWIRGIEESPYGGFYGIVAGILFCNAILWWEEGERRK